MELSGFPHFAKPDTFGYGTVTLKVGPFSQISSWQHRRHQKIWSDELRMGRTGANWRGRTEERDELHSVQCCCEKSNATVGRPAHTAPSTIHEGILWEWCDLAGLNVFGWKVEPSSHRLFSSLFVVCPYSPPPVGDPQIPNLKGISALEFISGEQEVNRKGKDM